MHAQINFPQHSHELVRQPCAIRFEIIPLRMSVYVAVLLAPMLTG